MDIARVNIRTGEGFCRINELWEFEGVIRSNAPLPEVASKDEEAGQEQAPSLLTIPDALPASLKAKLKVINLGSQGVGKRDISKRTGVPTIRVGHILRWKEQIILQAKVIDQHLGGKSEFQIADMLNTSPEWVKDVIKKYKTA